MLNVRARLDVSDNQASNPPVSVIAPIGISYVGGSIQIAPETLEQIRRTAVEQFLSIPRGGLEVGGVLYGTTTADGVFVDATQLLPIEHLFGPSFSLSAKDEENLAAQLSEAGNSHEEPLEVIGWWHSHTRTDVDITEEDLRIHRLFFGGDRQIALIIKPFKFDPCDVAVYAPNTHGSIPLDRFSFGPALRETQSKSEIEPAPSIAPQPAPEEHGVILTPSAVIPSWDADTVLPYPKHSSQRHNRRLLRSFAALACLCAGAFAWFYWPAQKAQTRPDPIQLSLSGTGNELTVRWDRTSSELLYAGTAELLVIEGVNITNIPLNAENLRSGTLSYVRHTGNVEVRMRARSQSNELYEAVARFVGPVPEQAKRSPSPPPQSSEEVQRMKTELDRLNTELQRMRTAETKPVEVKTKARILEHRIPFSAGTVAASRPAPLPTPVMEQQSGIVVTHQPQLVPAPQISTPPVIAAPAPVPAPAHPPKSPVAHLASGRAIWTGSLAKGGVLLFNGARPTSGAITGRMPQRPSRFRVHSGDLIDSGIVVYTNASKERIEPPSAANGWNLTAYRPDAKRARDIVVLEAPNPANSWQRLIVRSEQRTISMLVLEWEELP